MILRISLFAGVAKHGQRRKIEGLVLSGPRVQISSPALIYRIKVHKLFIEALIFKFSCNKLNGGINYKFVNKTEI
jgi:hypothetical protein